MQSRTWFYLFVSIILSGLISYWTVQLNGLNRSAQSLERQQESAQVERFSRYLATQSDERKLISLSKQIAGNSEVLLRLTIERAYELNPNSRDIVRLASYYRPELKERVIELDPLHSSN